MSLSELNEAVRSAGGAWVALKEKGDKVRGTIVDFEQREATFEGQVIVSRKTGKPRYEWVFVVTVPDEDLTGPEDDGLRKFSLREAGQRAVIKALKKADCEAEIGGFLQIAVVADKESSTSQPEFGASYGAPSKPLNLSAPEPEPATRAEVNLDDLF